MKVAVYGTLRQGYGNHRLLMDSSEFLGLTTTEDQYGMYSLGVYPYVSITDSSENLPNVVVEVYEVDDKTFEDLDRLEGYPRFYDRSEVKLSNGMTAWMYHIEGDIRRGKSDPPPVTDGDWLSYSPPGKR